MVSPTVESLDRELRELHNRASEFRNRIPSEAEDFRQRLLQQADDLDKQIKNMEEMRDKLRDAEEAVDKMPAPH